MLGSDDPSLHSRRNVARFFVENRAVAWVLLAATLAWGAWSYAGMPKRKDPETPVMTAAAVCRWPGASAERIEQLVTRKIEERLAENARVRRIESISRGSVAVVYVVLDDRVTDTGREWDDLEGRVQAIRDLPTGAGPVEFIKDFGDTAALMLTVASPKVAAAEIDVRARAVADAIRSVRRDAAAGPRAAIVTAFPDSVPVTFAARQRDVLAIALREADIASDVRVFDGSGFTGVDARFATSEAAAIGKALDSLARERLHVGERHPDMWLPAIVVEPDAARAALDAAVGDRYSYRALDQATDLIKRTLQSVPQVSKITRSGILPERIYLEYSQERLASFGVQTRLSDILNARNTTLPGGLFEAGDRSVTLDPSGEFTNESEIGDVIVGASAAGLPLYLRDGVDIVRGYDSPPRFLNFYHSRDARGAWHRSRAITLAIQMRPGEQIGAFGEAVDGALAKLRPRLPADLVLARTSDQPLQVTENLAGFTTTLYEAILLVVLVAFVGFWEWRSALLMAASIPITLAMTFGFMALVGMDVQQVSLVALIIALGLLVDDPVVAGDAITRELEQGVAPSTAAWLGPTRLAQAIFFATVTNIVAYLPLLLVQGSTGRFIRSLPIVLTCSLVASRLVSMTFIPLLGYHLLRAPATGGDREKTRGERAKNLYRRTCGWAIDHRWVVVGLSVAFVLGGGALAARLRTQFFPTDISYLSYADVWLPEDATFSATSAAADAAAATIRRVAEEYGRATAGEDGTPRQVLDSLTTFVGGGGPRFWFSVAPELQQLNYAQIVVKVRDGHDTVRLAAPLQRALSGTIPGARIDVRQLETSKPIGVPVAVRLSGDDADVLRALAERVKTVFRAVPAADRIRDDWGAESFVVALEVDADRANFAGVSNQEVALSSAAALGGYPLTVLREGDAQIPVVLRLRSDERARIEDLQNLYVYSMQGQQKVPLRQVSALGYRMTTEKIRRRNHFRTITVGCFPVPGALASQVVRAARPGLEGIERTLPDGYRLEIGGEAEEQAKGFGDLAVVMATSVAGIFMALVIQFRSAVKPLLVFAAVPYGLVGGLAGLIVMQSAFGFMAFLGIASLVGVIVSHVIVKFDFIEDMRARGLTLRQALVDAGAERLRPVFITIGATAFGLLPLAHRGGPVWEPLCYAQIAGLLVATLVTLVLVPVFYAIAVLDLRIISWSPATQESRS